MGEATPHLLHTGLHVTGNRPDSKSGIGGSNPSASAFKTARLGQNNK